MDFDHLLKKSCALLGLATNAIFEIKPTIQNLKGRITAVTPDGEVANAAAIAAEVIPQTPLAIPVPTPSVPSINALPPIKFYRAQSAIITELLKEKHLLNRSLPMT